MLNLGCGTMFKPDCINFDCVELRAGSQATDIIGRIEDMTSLFRPDTFSAIFCAHAIEHLYPDDGRKLIADCFSLLMPKGVLVLEGPDIEKIIRSYKPGHIQEAIRELYGIPKILQQYGEDWMHKWGWTGQLAAEDMTRCGFEIRFQGEGISHNKPERDYRVEGVKP
jgi:predicted SAM-dependent methyltransferase